MLASFQVRVFPPWGELCLTHWVWWVRQSSPPYLQMLCVFLIHTHLWRQQLMYTHTYTLIFSYSGFWYAFCNNAYWGAFNKTHFYCVYILFPPVCCNKKCFCFRVSSKTSPWFLYWPPEGDCQLWDTTPNINNQNVITSKLYSLILFCSIIQQSVSFCNHGCMGCKTVFKELARWSVNWLISYNRFSLILGPITANMKKYFHFTVIQQQKQAEN